MAKDTFYLDLHKTTLDKINKYQSWLHNQMNEPTLTPDQQHSYQLAKEQLINIITGD